MEENAQMQDTNAVEFDFKVEYTEGFIILFNLYGAGKCIIFIVCKGYFLFFRLIINFFYFFHLCSLSPLFI